jgi:DNA-binding transcriptional LysR family regulator
MSFDALTLEYFLAVNETRSFTRAAGKVSRTQSAVSQQITKLENQIGKPLFERGKNLSLTSEGEIFLSYAKRIIQLNREAMDRFTHPELHGEVRFGLPEDFASVFLSEILTEYVSLHPRIMLNVACDLTPHLLNQFKNNEFDLVLVKMNPPDDFPTEFEVWSEALEWVGNHQHFTSDQPIPLILSPQPCAYRARAIKALESHDRKWRIVFSSHSYPSTIAAVQAGMGVTILARNMVPDNLEIIHPSKSVPKLEDAHFSLLKHQHENLAINLFQNFVVDHMRH